MDQIKRTPNPRGDAGRGLDPHSKTLRNQYTTSQQAFRKDWLPTPVTYYREQGLKLIGGGAWRSALCPFHGDRSPSLRINMVTGAFRCMACEAHGGDVLAYHMQLHRLSFVEACKALGAWGGGR